MRAERFVVAGAAHLGSAWFADVARWATLGTVPVELLPCTSVADLRAHVAGGRMLSAALLDARLLAVDRDLLDALARAGVPALVVDDGSVPRPWAELGATAVLDADLSPDALRRALVAEARPIATATTRAVRVDAPPLPADRALVVTLVGRSGAGTSTLAAAVAQELAATATGGRVVLADCALHAQQAVAHDIDDAVGGLSELVEAHRNGTLDDDQVLGLTFTVPTRGYRLLPGLRQHRDWTTLGSRSVRAAIAGLALAASHLVLDADADLEGEADTGSFDVEDRNRLARTAVEHADVVVAVARPTPAGLHGLVVLLDDLRRAGVPPERIVAVLNAAPRLERARAELARSLDQLTPPSPAGASFASLVLVPARRGLDDVHGSVAGFPSAVGRPVVAAVSTVIDRCGRRSPSASSEPLPRPIAPGELGGAGRA